MLTNLEEQILITVWKLKGQGYGVNIFQHLEKINEKRITLGVVYDILERLTRHSFLETYLGKPTPVRGGMKKKFYKITKAGVKELVKSKQIYDRVMEGFSELLQQYITETKFNLTEG